MQFNTLSNLSVIMVCIPCIILPCVLAVYLKFIQPFIMRFVPDRWKLWFDSILYPTCPMKIPPENKPNSNDVNMVDGELIDPYSEATDEVNSSESDDKKEL